MPSKHYHLSPSASDRWLACPGSLAMSEGIPRKGNEYTDEGERAHGIGESLLRGNLVDATASREMIENVLVYVRFVEELRKNELIEEQIEFTQQCEDIEGLGGTADYFCLFEEDGSIVMHFVDLKYGVGVTVDPENNTQLLSYAVIVESHYPGMIDRVRLTIVQPRAIDGDTVKTWECGIDEVHAHRKRILDSIGKEDVVPGDHCRWCPAAVKCPALREQTQLIAETEFSSIQGGKDVEALLRIFEMGPAVKALIENVHDELLTLMRKGKHVPGYKVVRSLSHRRWVGSDEEVLRRLANRRVGKKIVTENRLKSPSQVEKLVGKEKIEGLTYREERGQKVVPISAKGEPIDFSQTEFTPIENEKIASSQEAEDSLF